MRDKRARTDPMGSPDDSAGAMKLMDGGHTMVLATCQDQRPWNAPVYYIHVPPGLYFFSSPRSRHIREALAQAEVAATIFAESRRWEEIEGVQMTGRVTETRRRSRQLHITGRYLLKFPLAREFLSADARAMLDLRDKVRLYCFTPNQVYYVSNRLGFGRRVLIEPGATDPKES